MSANSSSKLLQAMNCERCGVALPAEQANLHLCGWECSTCEACSDAPFISGCACCGGTLVRRRTLQTFSSSKPLSATSALDDLAAAMWVQAYDAAWLGQNWEELEQRLAPDVMFMAERFQRTFVGRRAVMADIRDFMRQARMHEYNATDLRGHSSGPVGVITYRWQLDCTIGQERNETTGRDVLILRAVLDDWQLVWRAQL